MMKGCDRGTGVSNARNVSWLSVRVMCICLRASTLRGILKGLPTGGRAHRFLCALDIFVWCRRLWVCAQMW